jgi:hypothetical protein
MQAGVVLIQASLACWDLRKQVLNEQAAAIAEKMAEKFARTEPPSPT